MSSKRKPRLANERFYHIFNRSIGREQIFRNPKTAARGLEAIRFYRFEDTPFPFSRLIELPYKERFEVFSNLERQSEKFVEVTCLCLMPNHYHLLVKQLKDRGIEKFVGNFQNSFAKFYNIVNERAGPLFESRFKAVLVGSNEELLHMSRYIHINPHTSGIVKDFEELATYPWSSLPQYLGIADGFCETSPIMANFKNARNYEEFLKNQLEYQKSLKHLKDMLFE